MTSTGTVLDSIIEGVREDLAQRRRAVPLAEMERRAAAAGPALDVCAHLRGDGTRVGLISEVKRASPSKGALAEIPDPAALAEVYAAGGAGAISVLTEQRRFGGSLADLDRVRERVAVPVLRKDFTVDAYQIHEARAHGADLILLIVAALEDAQLQDFADLAAELGMHALIETHTAAEVERAMRLDPALIGVNARDLKTLDVDLGRAARLISTIPEGPLAVGESAVAGVADVQAYADAGADAVLVGEALVTGSDPAAAVRAFTSVPRQGRPARPGTAASNGDTAR